MVPRASLPGSCPMTASYTMHLYRAMWEGERGKRNTIQRVERKKREKGDVGEMGVVERDFKEMILDFMIIIFFWRDKGVYVWGFELE